MWAITGDNLQLWDLLVVKLFELRKFKDNCLFLGEFDRYHSPGGIRSCVCAREADLTYAVRMECTELRLNIRWRHDLLKSVVLLRCAEEAKVLTLLSASTNSFFDALVFDLIALL